jgi:hypothetical protein
MATTVAGDRHIGWLRGGRSDFALRGGGRRVVETVGLVVNGGCDLLERVEVRARVVSAEEKFAATGQLDADVGLRAATVAAVDRGELSAQCYGCTHCFASSCAIPPGDNIKPGLAIPPMVFVVR